MAETSEPYRILLSNRVATELERIFRHVAECSPQNAPKLVERILDALDGLKTFPHRTVIKGRRPGARRPARSLLRWIWNGATAGSVAMCTLILLVLLPANCSSTAWDVGQEATQYYSDGSVAQWTLRGFSIEGCALRVGKWGGITCMPHSMTALQYRAAMENGDPLPMPVREDATWTARDRFSIERPCFWFSTVSPGYGNMMGYYWADCFVVPLWFLALIFGGVVLLGFFGPTRVAAVVGRRRSGRVRRGLCAACGYDMRATPERCPECGEVRRRKW